jgi:chromate transporter
MTNCIMVENSDRAKQSNLIELSILFLKLGLTAFGGPAAHIAIMEDEVVRRRRWMTQEKFLDLLGAVNLIPGPNSTEMAIYIGYLRAGLLGLVLGGVCFILPAMLMVMAIAWAYVRYGSLPQFEALMYGVKPVIIAVIFQALCGLGRKAAKTLGLAAIGLLAVAAAGYYSIDALTVILVGGVIAGLTGAWSRKTGRRLKPILVMLVVASGIIAFSAFAMRLGSADEVPFGFRTLFLYFLKIGSVLYGSGYVLLAFLQGDLVARWHWLSSGQLLDATAVGQVTPGPVFTTATFIGYILGGLLGAVLATVGIFLPSFVFIALSSPLVPRLRESPVAGAFLDGVNVASLALMAVVTWQLGRAAIFDATTLFLAVLSAVLLIGFRINSSWLVIGGAVLGLLAKSALMN